MEPLPALRATLPAQPDLAEGPEGLDLAPKQHVDQRGYEGQLADPERRAEILGAEELGEADSGGEGRDDDGKLREQGAGL
jgi:hypothetical protein